MTNRFSGGCSARPNPATVSSALPVKRSLSAERVEALAAKVRRYESPDEQPFHPRSSLPKAILAPLDYPALLHPNDVNVNPKIYAFYTEEIVPAITARAQGSGSGVEGEDDGNYGSSATRDVEALQAISRRIHYGASSSSD